MHKETLAVGNDKENTKRKAQANAKGIECTRQNIIRRGSRERHRESLKTQRHTKPAHLIGKRSAITGNAQGNTHRVRKRKIWGDAQSLGAHRGNAVGTRLNNNRERITNEVS